MACPPEEALCQQALELTSPAAREAFLIKACAGDEAWLAKVRERLCCDVYLDGKEVLRENLPTGPDTYLLAATVLQGKENDGVVHRFPLPGTLEPGQHLLAISVHNTENSSSDLHLGGVTLVETGKEAK